MESALEKIKTKHDEIIDRWKAARPEYISIGNTFTEDGVCNYDKWSIVKPRILFLLKENYDSGWDPVEGIKAKANRFCINIALWRFVLRELYSDISKELTIQSFTYSDELIDDIAFVEVKKVNENQKRSSYSQINEYAEKDKLFLQEQINLINPNIMVCCNTIDSYINIYNYLDNNDAVQYEELSSDSKCDCFKHKNRLVINFFHPSAFNKSSEYLFDLLVRLLKNGNVFKQFEW